MYFLASLYCELSNAVSNCLLACLRNHMHLFDLSPLCAFKCLLKSPAGIHVGCIWFFSTMCFQMCPHCENILTWQKVLTDLKKSLYTLQADPEKSRDFIIKNPGILINWKSRDPGIPGIPLGPGHHCYPWDLSFPFWSISIFNCIRHNTTYPLGITQSSIALRRHQILRTKGTFWMGSYGVLIKIWAISS